MGSILFAGLLIIIPLIGLLLGLILSQLEDSKAAEGKTRDWLLFTLTFVPSSIISILLLFNIHSNSSFLFEWLPGYVFGIRVNELSIIFAFIITNLSLIIALYTMTFMEYDRNRTRLWFFMQLSLIGLMIMIFANNILWLFGGIELTTIGAFFLVGHWFRKSGTEGENASKAAIRFFIMNLIGDIFILIGFAFIIRAFETSILSEIFHDWIYPPANTIGLTSRSTRNLIGVFIVIGALIKSAQIPILFWPMNNDKQDSDLAKSPLPISAFLLTTSVSNIGIYLISLFYPLFSLTGTEGGTGVSLFNPILFNLIGWFSIITIIFMIMQIVLTDNLNRIVIGISVIQTSFTMLAFSAVNQLGYIAGIFNLLSSAPASLLMFILFGMIIESLRINSQSRIGGLKSKYPSLNFMSLASLLTIIGLFPGSLFFSRDMVFKALLGSIMKSSIALIIISVICLFLLAIILVRSYFKLFYGQMDDNLSSRPVKTFSLFNSSIPFIWTIIFGLTTILLGYPKPSLFSNILNTRVNIGYDSLIFSDRILSPIILILVVIATVVSFIYYIIAGNNLEQKIANSKSLRKIKKVTLNITDFDIAYNYIIIKPVNLAGKFVNLTRLKSPFISVLWGVLSVVLLICIMVVVGGI